MDDNPTYKALHAENRRLKNELEKLQKAFRLNTPADELLFTDLVDLEQFEELITSLHELTGLGVGLVDTDRNILIEKGWHNLCNTFFNQHPLKCNNCHYFDPDNFTPAKEEQLLNFKCKLGIRQVESPITIGGSVTAILVFGQFFYDDDITNYKEITELAYAKHTQKSGFNDAVKKIPVLPREYVKQLALFYKKLSGIITDIGYQKLKVGNKLSRHKIQSNKIIKTKEMLLDNIIENLPVGLQIFDSDGNTIHTNKKQRDLLGLPNETIAKDFNVLTDPFSEKLKIKERFEFVKKTLKSSEKHLSIDFSLPENKFSKFKSKLDFIESIFPILDEDNNLTHFVALLTDITSKLLSEKLLLESEMKYKALFKHSGDAAFMMTKYKYIDCNESAPKLFKMSREELINKHPWEISPEYQANGKNSKDLIINYMDQVEETEFEIVDWIHIRPDGTQFYAQITLSFVDKEKDLYYVIIRDVTEETLYRNENERITQILSQTEQLSKIGSWEYDVETKKIFWTDGLYKIHKFDKNNTEEHIQESLKGYLENDREIILNTFHRCIEKGIPYDLEFQYRNKLNEKMWIRTKTRPIFENDKVVKVYGSVVDITEHKLIENNLLTLNATKDKFFSIIAHDLKSPYISILGFAELIMKNSREGNYSEIAEHCEMLYNSAKRNFELLNNLLQWSRAQTGHLKFQPDLFELNEIIDSLLTLFKMAIEEKHLSIKTDIPNKFDIVADRFMLSTIIRNLLSNAIKYSNSNSNIEIVATRNSDYITFFVKDYGEGIPADSLEKLFRIDENISTPGTNKEKGTGLGLILCKEFVEYHKGKIWVESKEHYGSTFYFTIPTENLQ